MLTVAAILKEDLPITLRFAAWYLAQGADKVQLFLDDPSDPAADLLEHHPNIDIIRCNDAFWAQLGLSRADRFTKRQNAVLTWAYQQAAPGGWLMNVDADELVYFEGRRLSDLTRTVRAGIASVRILPAEIVQSPRSDGTHFRLPMKRWARVRVYGEAGNVLIRRSGLVGHHVGKSMVRTGMPGVTLRQHWAQDAEGNQIDGRELGPKQGAYLLHMFDRGYASWRAKLDWRLSASGFRPPAAEALTALLASDDPESGLRALYDGAHVFAEDRIAVLKDVRAHMAVTEDLDAPAKALWSHLYPG